ncbi:MAG TPA: galactokinase, partial [Terriglobales bacterium]
ILKKSLPGTRALRDVSPAQLEQHSNELPEIIYRRCKHVVNENARAVQAMQTLRSGDLAEVGRLMAASHISLRDLYSVSCFELDLMVELANKVDGAIGARMTGGGFGGCTINLVHNDAVDRFRSTVKEGYKHATGIDPEIYVSRAANGAEEI